MPYRKYKNTQNFLPPAGNSQTRKIVGDIKKVVETNEFDFYEMEAFEVRDIFLDKDNLPNRDYKYYGAIRGNFIDNADQTVLPRGENWVLPLDPHIKRYPIPGENVVCVNYLGRTYYTDIINFRNSPNNNIKIGLPSSRTGDKKSEFYQTFDENLIYQRNIAVNPGDIVISGRFGSSIKVGSQNMVGSSIKLVSGHNKPTSPKEPRELEPSEPVEHDINFDAASIYIEDGGVIDVENPNEHIGTYKVGGKKIILNADVIVVNARKILRLTSGELVEIIGKDVEIKHNQGDGRIFTGETATAIDNLRNKPLDRLDRELRNCLEQLRQATYTTQEDFDNAKELWEKISNIDIDFRAILDRLKNIRPTMFTDEYIFLVRRWNNVTEKFNDDTDPINQKIPNTGMYSDPVGRINLYMELVDILNEFAKLEFLRFDIVTD